jgi:hypothetical protein
MTIRASALSATLAAACCLAPQIAFAQDEDQRFVAFGDAGYARTYDDEGLLGGGASLTAGFGVRLMPRLTLQALVNRLGYHRDEDWLTFDGRVLFTGVEAAFYGRSRKIRGFWSIGGGVFNDDGVAIWKSTIDPRLPRVEERVDRGFTLAAMTASGGIEVPVTSRASVRAGVRFHGLLDTGDDAAPHTIVQPTIGMSWRW